MLDFDRRPIEVNDIAVLEANLRASNGLVHIIGGVLQNPDPRPTIVDLAVGAPQLSILTQAVVRVGLDTVLAAGGPFTVFAPTDAAFGRLLNAVGAASLDDIDDTTLVNVLLDHIVVGEFDAVELSSRRRAMGGLKLRFNPRQGTVNGISIEAVDVEAINGTVHIIGDVLLGG